MTQVVESGLSDVARVLQIQTISLVTVRPDSLAGSSSVTAHVTSFVCVDNHCKNSSKNTIFFYFYLSLTCIETILLVAEKGLSFIS